ncbi:uncharacterized protein A1O9_05051 [Exophiala aquamarina CBS 119918]|uniref:RING-type domain-containing protein n=1 Tax=Exophiala aquamarina CBS 119918 TaxID=1182545 RepID=A0A072PJZ4_9EURO|nr:uncharacterized protein A1O9_05051 [Exophiala aquamarina CBS 119918]KEF60201.1 hypothetical protein A1O9_05051 [Exophiala aquamarina CBS 119918]
MASSIEAPSTGLLNLEKELVCFICTEILYQPLTLLDCLHSFCGSCLKEWFSHQHRKATHSHSASPANTYTCPTCRAPVKDAQHNAMINTLLDMFLAANPTKGRSAEEKAEMAQAYTPGDGIMPKVESHRRRERRRREEDEVAGRQRRTANDAIRERSRPTQLLDPVAGHSGRSTSGRSGSRENRDRTETSRDSDRRHRRDQPSDSEAIVAGPRTARSSSSADLSSLSPPVGSPRHPDAVEARQRGARTVAHQASLRSLVSASESGTGTGESLSEAQLMQEILAEGLLDGINVDELTEAEQDELSERIADRYRQLHPERLRRQLSDEARHERRHDSLPTLHRQPEVQIEEAGRHSRQSSRSAQRRQTQPSPRSSHNVTVGGTEPRPPTSYPQITEQTLTLPQTTSHRRRASNESGRSENATTRSSRRSNPGGLPNSASRSATDLSERPQSSSFSANHPHQLSNSERSNTEPHRSPRASDVWRAGGNRVSSPPEVDSPTVQSPLPESSRAIASGPGNAPVPVSPPRSDPATLAPEPMGSLALLTRFDEPSISCARCARENIQYEVHKHCGPCELNICMTCYRAGRGCNHWFGFGHAAMFKFDSSHPRSSQAIELPHILVGRQYQKPPSASRQGMRGNIVLTNSDPASRQSEGNFCDRCGKFANACFWSCDYCNDGEWGFCNDCINTNHCCTHPLLPVAHKSYDPRSKNSRQPGAITHSGSVTLSPYRRGGRDPSPAQSAPSSAASANGLSLGLRADFVPLIITTNCDVCARPIAPGEMRHHCPSHPTPSTDDPNQKGDFDICNDCYLGFVKTGRLKRENGPDGWHMCPDEHRMISIAFDPDQDGGQRRAVIRDLVGGTKMSDADVAAWKQAHSQPSGLGATLVANRGQWSWREDATGSRRTTRARTGTLPISQNVKFPPDGGVGKVCRAMWSYYPEDGEEGKGELMFPKHAEIREAEEVNEEWWYGVYSGDLGVFPSIYVREAA